jgi:hypothetical protein
MEVIVILIWKDAEIEAEDNNGKKPHDLATKNGNSLGILVNGCLC